MLDMLAKLLKILNSDAAPGQIALAFAFALIVGLTPFFSLHNLIVLFFVLVLRVNLSAFLLASAFFSLIAYLVNPASAALGEYLLTLPSLQEFWISLYQSELARVSRFNHTLLLGSLVVALLAFIPMLLISRKLVVVYREKFMAWFEKLRVVKFIKASRFYKIYTALAE